MMLKEKVQKNLSQLNELFSELSKISLNMKTYVVILEDLYNLLEESTYKGDPQDLERRNDFEEIQDNNIYVEDYLSSSLKYQIEKDIDTCFAACEQIYKKQKSSLLKKTWQYLKILIFDDPEEVLQNENFSLLQKVLRVRLELKEKNFAILYKEITELRANQEYQYKYKRISEEQTEHKQSKPQQKMNTVYNLKNKNNLSGGEILDEKSNDNQLSFETPLPPDANNKFKNLGQYLKPNNSTSQNFFAQLKKDDQSSNSKSKPEKTQITSIKYKLEPQTHESLYCQDNFLQEVSICKIINLSEDMDVHEQYSYKDFYQFKRAQYIELLKSRQQDLGRISRNHASLRVKINNDNNQVGFYLVNHSPNGTYIQKSGTTEWIKLKEVGQESQIFEGDQIGLLFDSQDPTMYLIGYKFQLIE
ncbi:hypothetical protein TTHERM_00502440 (macronuclear) [Tetrahymena thermophila SB210]|uniref:FHA domain-containing protein n=1 Tax=Tetrahymena thermophila (strain SB210) TaxID=312017 RepID=I7MGU4_TETTS|nr:hypothetical protein TTHERM_00502440 [Tetrahymena thermophila SB210]EAS02053.2 hypothetical protein TTHERM_00502440 [Tetrahymena thermophila SB210]|eukprot:XP_001022298.2 hypothetical protein TTHERM_00502440 [Tetrahymena thermophila SB210]